MHGSHISRLKDTLDMVWTMNPPITLTLVAVIKTEPQTHVETTDRLIVTRIYLFLVRKHYKEDLSLS